MNPPEPQKTAVDQMDSSHPLARQMHFLISRVIKPALPTYPIELVELEAVFSKATQTIPWRELQDDSVWRQGWV
ncbi:TIGR02450 family Trp-rich protein [Limnohabitans sp. 2KL-3]|jgi:tryptophan-rich hypothetical protein|uniref:TIGR02450 family Trp-rich protein n=1 Tax=Limnohabitans sp. 2KL-3 TaxID=1100700 RepID=UPI000AF1DBFC